MRLFSSLGVLIFTLAWIGLFLLRATYSSCWWVRSPSSISSFFLVIFCSICKELQFFISSTCAINLATDLFGKAAHSTSSMKLIPTWSFTLQGLPLNFFEAIELNVGFYSIIWIFRRLSHSDCSPLIDFCRRRKPTNCRWWRIGRFLFEVSWYVRVEFINFPPSIQVLIANSQFILKWYQVVLEALIIFPLFAIVFSHSSSQNCQRFLLKSWSSNLLLF